MRQHHEFVITHSRQYVIRGIADVLHSHLVDIYSSIKQLLYHIVEEFLTSHK